VCPAVGLQSLDRLPDPLDTGLAVRELGYFSYARDPDVSRFQARGKTGKVRKLYQCLSCRRQFSATGGTIFHDSHRPLTDWLLAIYVLDCSKDANLGEGTGADVRRQLRNRVA
jgi:hypothetical protein